MLILDTHAWVEWVNSPEILPTNLRLSLENSEESLSISIISCYEVALLVNRGRITLDRPIARWFDEAIQGAGIESLGMTPEIAEIAAGLPQIHKDPWDRLIIATAQAYNVPLVTRDENIHKYPNLQAVWNFAPERQ